ncbi:MAG TPA: sn-glycerol-3-phosphate ABC transporter ATP-binding protein UgpC [Acidimicrobiales bacterium]|nr:sn-glycerol-3-phosphate ABC transporter ATP-binding protein UgpC [Acidimicrobiales bacterium]
MAEIVMEHVTKRFPDGTEAVSDVNLKIGEGEFMILVGPSGCGKSTLLNMICGLEDISDGELRFDGEVVNQQSPKDRNIAMVFQNYALYPHLTVRENMAFPLRLAKVDDAEVNKRVEEAARVLELGEHLDRKPANLSGGQRQRVAMGRAIVREPVAFLLDEPLSNLDAKLRVQMRTEISRLQNRLRTTTVYVTHDQTEAMTLGDRVAVLRKGKVQQVDSPKGLYNDPVNLFVAGFIGSPAMNFLPARLEGDQVHLPVGSYRGSHGASSSDGAGSASGSREVIAGVRPEHFEDATLVGDDDRQHGLTFSAKIDVIEWMGSELFAYFDLEGQSAASGHLQEIASDLETVEMSAGADQGVVARLDAASSVKRGDTAELWLDTRRVLLFDTETGERLPDLRSGVNQSSG